MKHYIFKHTPATTKRVCKKVTCDLCGEETDNSGFDVDNVEVTCRTGEQYPECGSGEEIEVDMCSDCFKNKLVPWLEEQGATIETKEWSN